MRGWSAICRSTLEPYRGPRAVRESCSGAQSDTIGVEPYRVNTGRGGNVSDFDDEEYVSFDLDDRAPERDPKTTPAVADDEDDEDADEDDLEDASDDEIDFVL